MNKQVEKILADVGNDTLTLIARNVIDDDSTTLVGDLAFAEITNNHNDDRTIGIVKVSGTAVSARNGCHHKWGSVVKIIDQSVPTNDDAAWGFPENEVKVYEQGLLNDDEVQLRPAKCYLAQKNSGGLHVLWLEDLSAAPQPPWTLDHFISTASHLGQFNGYHFGNKTKSPIEVTKDAYYLRMAAFKWHSDYSKLMEIPDDPILRRVFGDIPLEPGLEYAATYERAVEVAKSLPHSLSFGDSHSRNLFPLGSETVGIDWASLAFDPIGCDIGVLIGSPLSFGKIERQLIAQHEQKIYESYVDGLKSSGWTGNLDHVRLGFFLQFSQYVLRTTFAPLNFEQRKRNDVKRAFTEQRTGAPIDEFPELSAHVVELLPKYAEEFKQLLERVEETHTSVTGGRR
jgi:hypothetical protein